MTQDLEQALRWYRDSAGRGNAQAQEALGRWAAAERATFLATFWRRPSSYITITNIIAIVISLTTCRVTETGRGLSMMRGGAILLLAVLATVPTPGYAQMTTAGPLAGAEGWYLRTADEAGELFVLEIGGGAGIPVVVLHGGPGADFTYLLPIANGLEPDLHFVFYDQRGSLRSRVTPDSISMANHVADLDHLREALGAEKIKLVSHSAGTMLAFAYLQAHPDRVATRPRSAAPALTRRTSRQKRSHSSRRRQPRRASASS